LSCTLYPAFVCARQRIADCYPGQPIASYIDEVMATLDALQKSPGLRKKEIEMYMTRQAN
jgi:hypothetical protein